MNPVKALENHGQAIWLDFLARGFVTKGDLKALIDTDGVKGVTSNPSIFEKAIGSSDEYDGAIGHALKAGDRVSVEMPYATFEYAIVTHRIVQADDLSVLRSGGREELVLQACHPRFFATHRYIVDARLVGVAPRGGEPYTPSVSNS